MKRLKISQVIVSFVLLAYSSVGSANSPILNLGQIYNSLNFQYFERHAPLRAVRVAVIDKGFAGYESQIGLSLPDGTRFVPGPVETSQPDTEHGLVMAQIVSGLLDASRVDFELLLLKADGFSNFRAAIDKVMDEQVDVVLYSEVWDYGNNFNGGGFINQEVHRATDAGVLWVNAAGNFARGTYNTPILIRDDGFVQLPDENNGLKVMCLATQCQLRVVATWNDYNEDIDIGTDKDLDIALFDDFMNVVAKAGLKQSSEKILQPGHTRYPREILQAEVKKGVYYIKAKGLSKNFNVHTDRLRFVVGGDQVLVPRFDRSESLNNPADSPHVITVGANDSVKSSQSVSLRKPELLTPSSVLTSRGEFRGSSNSAAIAAAVAATWFSKGGEGGRLEFLRFLGWPLN